MKIIISPAKKMKIDTDTFTQLKLPVFLSDTELLMKEIQDLSFDKAKMMWACSEKIAEENFRRFKEMDLRKNLTPAILSYDGIQYTYMAPTVFETAQFQYIQKHLRILSGFYGVLKPMDGVVPYRLEMQAKLSVAGAENLYKFWGDKLYHELSDESRVIINLASKEYSKCIEKYITDNESFITCDFTEKSGTKLVQKGVYAKMARGEMVRFMAENNITNPKDIKKFNRLGYAFSPELSTDVRYIFIKQ